MVKFTQVENVVLEEGVVYLASETKSPDWLSRGNIRICTYSSEDDRFYDVLTDDFVYPVLLTRVV